MVSEKIGNYIDKYEILEEVGRGGMGSVYKALHPQFKKYVAIKEIKSDLASDPEFRRRFEREVEILAQLPSHQNIVTVRDALVYRGQLFLVMDYIEGSTLNDLVSGEGTTPGRGAELLNQILSGLEAIHRSGIVHRDLKPSNILIDRQGVPYISDFGIAKSAGIRSPDRTMGTAEYAAPELLDQGLSRGCSELQIDVYALGLIAYKMLLGKKRFRSEFSEVYNTRPDRVERWILWHTDLLRAARNLNDIDPTIPRPLANVVGRMMAKDVGARYGNGGDARRDLMACLPVLQDSRGRRSEPPPEDPTIPLDQIRGGGSRRVQPAPPRQVGRSSYFQRTEGAVRREPPLVEASDVDVGSTSPPAPPHGGTRSVPRWVWWTGGAVALVVVGAVMLVPLLFASPGFVLIVKGAPFGSDVYVDNKRVGIPVKDGSIRAFGLEVGRRSVFVACEGCEPYQDSVTVRDGEQKELLVSMSCNGEQSEIEYNGLMILIGAGEFEMGDDNHEPNERPKHPVSLPAYYIDKFEVTNRQYRRFCSEKNWPPPPNPFWDQHYFENNPDSPVVGVTWEDARKYAEWAGKDLPSEEQWEKAASWDPKKKEKRQYPWGNTAEPGRANIGSRMPAAVGHFAGDVSAYGVQDLAGNVSEWLADDYQPYRDNSVKDSHYGGGNKVFRGTNFGPGTLADARTTARYYHAPGFSVQESAQHSYVIGFRCAVRADDPKLKEHLRKNKKRSGQ